MTPQPNDDEPRTPRERDHDNASKGDQGGPRPFRIPDWVWVVLFVVCAIGLIFVNAIAMSGGVK